MVSDTPIGAGPAYLVVMPLRVVAEDIVTQLGARHGLAHRRRRPRDGVAAQVDDAH